MRDLFIFSFQMIYKTTRLNYLLNLADCTKFERMQTVSLLERLVECGSMWSNW